MTTTPFTISAISARLDAVQTQIDRLNDTILAKHRESSRYQRAYSVYCSLLSERADLRNSYRQLKLSRS